jgi:hypothetical protein
MAYKDKMKTEKANQDDDGALGSLLQAWKVRETLPPRFQQQVWHRVEREEARKSTSLLDFISRWLVGWMAKRSMAISYVALLLLTGLASGYWQGRVSSEHTSHSLSTRYVRMMDPYQATHQ